MTTHALTPLEQHVARTLAQALVREIRTEETSGCVSTAAGHEAMRRGGRSDECIKDRTETD